MNLKRIWIMFRARNHEFFRDTAAFGWNFLFPFLIVGGFAVIFGDGNRAEFRVGVFPWDSTAVSLTQADIPKQVRQLRYVRFIGFSSADAAQEKLKHHKIDLLIRAGSPAGEYWVTDSPKGYLAEQVFKAALAPDACRQAGERREIRGVKIRYIDWLFPGILGMNMMFSALWGVGFVIVRYRKNGVLKRLKVTPLTPFEYLSAQMLSRIFLIMFTLVVMWFGCDLFLHFHMAGSYLSLFLVFLVGGCSLCALGLIVAARGSSEEFSSGVVNFIGWPMMFLSEVWFSIEGAPGWVRQIAEIFPLTHILRAARRVMNDGAGLADVAPELIILSAMTLVCLTLGSLLFSWND
ncbi:ABC transporter permease [Desulfonema ishimotonii]|uniref:Transport permease protein n=2 Tax=Desulfonema ishimotonii TaxID=45657 RepID=A0A401G2B5_9BACT|nr:ABC transporter permease [Desulfonema ishimotonii]